MELYYYTTTDTLKFILEKADIFATNIHYMNDAEEYINGLEGIYGLVKNKPLIEEWEKVRGRTLDKEGIKAIFCENNLQMNRSNMEYYSISFCKKNDLLSQWAIYAKESGVSIKLRFDKDAYKFSAPCLGESLEQTGDETAKAGERKAVWSSKPEEIEYFTYNIMQDEQLPEEDKEAAFKILDRLFPDSNDVKEGKSEDWRFQSAFVKRYDFYQEAECRLLFDPTKASEMPKIEYRSDKRVLKPYLDITCEGGWPIWEIMVGPGFNQEIVYESLRHFLDHVEVKNGITSAEEYMNRVKGYLGACSVVKNEYYKQLNTELKNLDKLKGKSIEEIKILFWSALRELRLSVLNNTRKSKAKQYYEENYFTRSGIVLRRSGIPYIF